MNLNASGGGNAAGSGRKEYRMASFADLQEARAFFSGDRYAMDTGVTLEELYDGGAVCSLELTEHHRNAEGGVMGGVIFTLMDFTFAAASSNTHRPTVAQQVSVNYLNAPKGGRLTARAACRKDGRTSCVYQVNVTDDRDRDVAQAVFTGFKL